MKKILDKQLDKLTQRTVEMPVDQGLKTSLSINSTKSLIHNADEILKAGSVPELGARVANTAKWITYAVTGAFVAFVGITSAPVVMLVVGVGALGAGIYGAGSGKDIAEKAYEFFG